MELGPPYTKPVGGTWMLTPVSNLGLCQGFCPNTEHIEPRHSPTMPSCSSLPGTSFASALADSLSKPPHHYTRRLWLNGLSLRNGIADNGDPQYAFEKVMEVLARVCKLLTLNGEHVEHEYLQHTRKACVLASCACSQSYEV